MIYTAPHYYNRFHCIASDCPDTCCAGWAIMIDEASLKKYRHMKGAIGGRLYHSIDWREGSFCQYEGRCAFLNEKNLCDLYTEAGPKSLCRICRTYPRHVEEFEGVREISLCMSCIEAARIILSCEEPVRFLTREDEREEAYEEFDCFLYTKLADARELILRILQDRSLPVTVRISAVLGLAHDIQGRIRDNRLYETDQLLNRVGAMLKDSRLSVPVHQILEKYGISQSEEAPSRFHLMKSAFSLLSEMEVLNQDWPSLCRRTEEILYGEGEKKYGLLRKQFLDSPEAGRLSLLREQLMVYFVFTYFCGAVYNGSPYGKMKLAVLSVLLIEELVMGCFAEREGSLDFKDLADLSHRFSREVEHSDLNKTLLEERSVKDSCFSMKALLGAIWS